MKKLKIFVWIAMLFILQLTLAHYLTVSGIEAMFILPFIAAFALLEEDFRYTVMVGAICGICTGSLMGYNFFLSMVFILLSAIVAFNFKKRPLYMPHFIKSCIWTALLSLIWETMAFFTSYFDFTQYSEIFISHILIAVIYNTFMIIIIYPLLKKTIYEKEKQRKLII